MVQEGDNMRGEQTPDFADRRSIPVDDYDVRVRIMNPGYELVFELVAALLRARCPDDARVLLAGAGGSTEVRAFGSAAPGWRLTAVDPSAEMLARAKSAAEAAGLAGRAAGQQ
jgi:tRNA (cmo5U34)-methyltransferase